MALLSGARVMHIGNVATTRMKRLTVRIALSAFAASFLFTGRVTAFRSAPLLPAWTCSRFSSQSIEQLWSITTSSSPQSAVLPHHGISKSTCSSSSLWSSLSAVVSPFDSPEWQAWDADFVEQRQAAVPAVEVVNEMPEPLPGNLHNRYYLLRHGQSTANLAEIISSDRATLAYSTEHGLTDLGYQQGRAAATPLLDALEEGTAADDSKKKKVVLVSSPFARARQTAQACLDGLREQGDRVKELGLEIDETVVLRDLLVERYFGRLDGERIYTYSYVWPLDKFNTTHSAFDCESVAAVCCRLRRLVMELEDTYASDHHHIVLVSHADVLQIAQLYAANAPNVGYFSSYRFASKCGVRVRVMERVVRGCDCGQRGILRGVTCRWFSLLTIIAFTNRRRSTTHGCW